MLVYGMMLYHPVCLPVNAGAWDGVVPSSVLPANAGAARLTIPCINLVRPKALVIRSLPKELNKDNKYI